MDSIKQEQLPELFESVAKIMADKCEELCAMDARLGDGDLGLTMKNGFAALPAFLREIDEPDMGKRVMKAGMKMGNLIPSTMGTLMSAGIMGGGKAISGKTEIDSVVFAAFLNGFVAGVDKRSRIHRGECCLLDALCPAAERASTAVQAGKSLLETVREALRGAGEGLEMTKTMIPVFGKAAVHAAAAQGEPDQGAVAGYYMLEGMKLYICG